MRYTLPIEPLRAHFAIDALRIALHVESDEYAALFVALHDIERCATSGQVPLALGTGALSRAWTLIDMHYKSQRLLKHIRGFERADPAVQMYTRRGDDVQALRNYYQHLDSELPTLTANSTPIMGMLSWVDDDGRASLAIAPTAGSRTLRLTSPVLDTHTGRIVGPLTLTVGDRAADLAELHRMAERLAARLDEWLSEQGWLGAEVTGIPTLIFRVGTELPGAGAAGAS